MLSNTKKLSIVHHHDDLNKTFWRTVDKRFRNEGQLSEVDLTISSDHASITAFPKLVEKVDVYRVSHKASFFALLAQQEFNPSTLEVNISVSQLSDEEFGEFFARLPKLTNVKRLQVVNTDTNMLSTIGFPPNMQNLVLLCVRPTIKSSKKLEEFFAKFPASLRQLELHLHLPPNRIPNKGTPDRDIMIQELAFWKSRGTISLADFWCREDKTGRIKELEKDIQKVDKSFRFVYKWVK